MRWYHYLYLPETQARALGFTHHGRIFGVPAWLRAEGDDLVIACPKLVVLQFYAMVMDALFEVMATAAAYVNPDLEFLTPLFFGAELGREPTEL